MIACLGMLVLIIIATTKMGPLGLFLHNMLVFLCGSLYVTAILTVFFCGIYKLFFMEDHPIGKRNVFGLTVLNLSFVLLGAYIADETRNLGELASYAGNYVKVLSQDVFGFTGGLSGNLIYSVLKVKYTFYAEDGSHVSAVVQSEGMDSADKSSNKAMSAACKYALFQVFNIPTKELIDPDATTPEKSVKKTAPQTERSDYPGDEVMLKKFSLPANFKTSMTLEEAESFQSKDGKTYGEMKVQELFELLSSMTDALKRNGLTPSQKENLQNRITAIYLLFDTAKKQGGF